MALTREQQEALDKRALVAYDRIAKLATGLQAGAYATADAVREYIYDDGSDFASARNQLVALERVVGIGGSSGSAKPPATAAPPVATPGVLAAGVDRVQAWGETVPGWVWVAVGLAAVGGAVYWVTRED